MSFNIEQFKLLHNHLVSILTTNNHQKEHLGEKIQQYIEMIVESQKYKDTREDVFDYFCQKQGVTILRQVLQEQPLLSVRCLSLLFINLKNQEWIRFLLCQSFLMDAIQLDEHPQDQQWSQYFIAFLKSLSIRITPDQVNLFYNKKFCKFPLIYEAIKYFNHPDCMVRTNVMNIILGILKIKNPRLSTYFGSFPFTSYILTFCSEISQMTLKFNDFFLEKQSQTNNLYRSKSAIKMYTVDLSDYICYLNDLISFSSDNLTYFVRNALGSYILLPQLKHIPQDGYLTKSSLYTIHALLKIIRDKNFIETICAILLCKKIPKCFLKRYEESNIYYPKVYKNQFKQNTYYWDKFNFQIIQECLKKFEDIQNFQTQYQIMKKKRIPNQDQQKQYKIEIQNISRFLGFNIINYQQYLDQRPLFPKKFQYNNPDFEINTLRENFLNLLQSDDDEIVMGISSIILLLVRSQYIENDLLRYCGLLFPRMDTVNYLDDYNIKSLNRIQQACLQYLSKVNFRNIRVSTLRNILLILQESLFKQLDKGQKQIVIKAYNQTINILRQQIKLSNIHQIVQNFQDQYIKWSKDSISLQLELPFSIFVRQQENLNEIRPQYLLKNNKKQQIIRLIEIFTLMRSFYSRYLKNFQERQLIKFTNIHNQKFNKLQDVWKIGESYTIQLRNLVQCRVQRFIGTNKIKANFVRVIIVEDNYNMVIVQPSLERNQAKILLNAPWKHIQCTIDRDDGKKMYLHVRNSHELNNSSTFFFEDDIRCAGTLEWISNLKRKRYQQQQAFILVFVRDCLEE